MDIPFVDNEVHTDTRQHINGFKYNDTTKKSAKEFNSDDSCSMTKVSQLLSNISLDASNKTPSYSSTAKIIINSPKTNDQHQNNFDFKLDAKEIQLPLKSDNDSDDKTYEVITYYNDIYATSMSPTHLTATNNSSPSSPSIRLVNGLNGQQSPYLRTPYYDDTKSMISEMSSICEFDSDGEEIEMSEAEGEEPQTITQNGKISFKLNHKECTTTTTNLVNIQNYLVDTKVAAQSENEVSPQLPYHMIDRFGFFGGNQYLPPPPPPDGDHFKNVAFSSALVPNLSPTSTDLADDHPSKNATLKSTPKRKDAKVAAAAAKSGEKVRARALDKLREREKKWKGMLDHWDKYLKHKPEKVRQRCRKGIPPSVRGLAWQRLCGALAARGKNTELFNLLASEHQRGDPLVMDEIRRDLHRQFPYHEMFAQPDGQGQRDLFAVLKVYSLMRPADGYCQAQAPLAATLLMQMPAEPAFWCLLSLCDNYLPGYFGPGLEALQLDAQLFYALLKRHQPAVYRLLRTQNIQPSLCLTEWFMCLYTRTLPWPCVLRAWDLFLSEGVSILFKVALVLFKIAFSPRPSVVKALTPTTPVALERQSTNATSVSSLPLLQSLTSGGSASALRARFPTMYETMGALQALKTTPIDEEYLIAEVLKLKIPKEAFERERQHFVEKRSGH